MQKTKWLSEDVLQIAVKRREVKSKGKKERYTHLNAEFERIEGEIRKSSSVISAKKQRKAIEWEKLEIYSRNQRYQGKVHAKMGLIKDRNGMDLIEAEDVQKSWQEYTGEQYKKELHDPDNHNGVITNLEPDILECEVKWALTSSL